jgi:hypothetical protein
MSMRKNLSPESWLAVQGFSDSRPHSSVAIAELIATYLEYLGDSATYTSIWLNTHRSHGGEVVTRVNDYQPNRGVFLMFTLSCTCGAHHVLSSEGCIDCDIAPDGICFGHANG